MKGHIFMWLFGVVWFVGGAGAFYAGYTNFDAGGKWPPNQFWSSVIGAKWANRLNMAAGVVMMLVGAGFFCLLGINTQKIGPIPQIAIQEGWGCCFNIRSLKKEDWRPPA